MRIQNLHKDYPHTLNTNFKAQQKNVFYREKHAFTAEKVNSHEYYRFN